MSTRSEKSSRPEIFNDARTRHSEESKASGNVRGAIFGAARMGPCVLLAILLDAGFISGELGMLAS